MSLHDIKDRTPNESTISTLKKLLKEAEEGELRSILYVLSYDDQSTSNGWSYDDRCRRVTMLGEFKLASTDFSASVLNSFDSCFSRIIAGD